MKRTRRYVSLMNRRITRSYRVDPELWKNATRAAREAKVTLSTAISRLLRGWVEGKIPLPTERTELVIEEKKKEE